MLPLRTAIVVLAAAVVVIGIIFPRLRAWIARKPVSQPAGMTAKPLNEAVLAPYRASLGKDRGALHLLAPPPRNPPEDYAAWRVTIGPLRDYQAGTSDLFPRLEWPAAPSPDAVPLFEVEILLAFTRWVPRLVPGVDWHLLSHQAGGVSNRHPLFVVRRLTPRPGIYEDLRRIARDDAQMRLDVDPGGHIEPGDATEVFNLNGRLKKLGLTCEHVGHCLDESVYPIDATADALARITADDVRLDALIDGFDAEAEETNLAILILAENSD